MKVISDWFFFFPYSDLDNLTPFFSPVQVLPSAFLYFINSPGTTAVSPPPSAPQPFSLIARLFFPCTGRRLSLCSHSLTTLVLNIPIFLGSSEDT